MIKIILQRTIRATNIKKKEEEGDMGEQLYKIIMRCPACKRVIDESEALGRDEVVDLRKHNTLAKICTGCDRKARASTILVN